MDLNTTVLLTRIVQAYLLATTAYCAFQLVRALRS